MARRDWQSERDSHMGEHEDHLVALNALTANEPPIQVGQIWSIRSVESEYAKWDGIVRVIRILGEYPERSTAPTHVTDPEQRDLYEGRRRWIHEDAPNVPTPLRRGHREISVIPEYNLRRIFRLDAHLTPPEHWPKPRYPQVGDRWAYEGSEWVVTMTRRAAPPVTKNMPLSGVYTDSFGRTFTHPEGEITLIGDEAILVSVGKLQEQGEWIGLTCDPGDSS